MKRETGEWWVEVAAWDWPRVLVRGLDGLDHIVAVCPSGTFTYADCEALAKSRPSCPVHGVPMREAS